VQAKCYIRLVWQNSLQEVSMVAYDLAKLTGETCPIKTVPFKYIPLVVQMDYLLLLEAGNGG
jgi:hypothetical protein